MSEPTTPEPAPQAKPQINLPAGYVAFCNEAEKRALGIAQFKYPSTARSDALIVARPTIDALLAELTRLGIAHPPLTPPPAQNRG
jgi:hypothetical protein